MGDSLTFRLLLLAVLIHDVVCSSKHVISVDSSLGHDSLSCLKPESGSSCQTLEYVESQFEYVSIDSVIVEICQPGIYLNEALSFNDFVDLSIQGESGPNPVEIVCNTSNAGISFVNVHGLFLSHINITDCGVSRNLIGVDQKTPIIEVSALYIINCYDVNITYTSTYRSNGTGITIIDTYGKVDFKGITVVESYLHSVDCPETECDGGRGLNILFYTPNATTGPLLEHNQIGNTTYTLNGIISMTNFANSTGYPNETCGYAGVGGGILIMFGNTNVKMTISESLIEENHSYCGGGIFVVFFNFLMNNHLSLIRTNISNNVVNKGRVGGGLQVFYCNGYPNYQTFLQLNTLRFNSCNIRNNSEGGVNIWSEQMTMLGDERMIFFTDCVWSGNNATMYGAAVHIMAGTLATGSRGHYPTVVFANCSFSSNRVKPTEQVKNNLATQINAVGAFYSSVLTLVFEGRTVFMRNYGTALYLSCSIASFSASSNVSFNNNYGTNGGAIALIGRSYLYLNGSSTFSFVNNTATQFGGAIYFHSIDTIAYQPCFIYNGIPNNISTFYLNRNHGSQGPHIFVSSFGACNLSISCNSTDVLQCLGDFTFEHPQNKPIGTLPTNFTLDTSLITLYPGLPQQFGLTVSDAEGNIVPNISYQATLSKNSSAIRVDSHYQYVSNNTISIDGVPRKNDTLQLNVLSTDISLLLRISLLECPPGYTFDNDTMICKCRALDYYGLLKCDPQAYIRYGIWMGKCKNNSILCTSDCPTGYCHYHNKKLKLEIQLPMNVSQLETKICAPNRRGTICGSCKENYSVYYNSWYFECRENKQCHLGLLYFTLSTVIPLTVFFIVITLLDTNFANGWNGFILFAQVARTLSFHGNGTIHYTGTQNHILGWILFTYRFFNMELFYTKWTQFCMWKGATFMDLQMVKLGSIVFALVLVFLTLCVLNQRKIARCFPCLSRRRYTVINGISTFFILCYTQSIETCVKILTTTCLIDVNNTCVRRVALYSGDMEAFENPHLTYTIVAVVFIVFIVFLPPVLLLMYPLFFKLLGLCQLSESKIAIFLWRIMPIQILDSFQNPFKDKYRFFAGFYLLYRALILVMHTIPLTEVGYYAAVELVLVSITVLHSLFQPYKKRLHNIIDLLLFLNLAFLNGIAQYTYATFATSQETVPHEKTIDFWNTLMIILLFIPLICVAAYVVKTFLFQIKLFKMFKRGYHAIQSSI